LYNNNNNNTKQTHTIKNSPNFYFNHHNNSQTREHVNRRDTNLGASFSPCLRYVACGSEEKGRAVLYDLRTSRAVNPATTTNAANASASVSAASPTTVRHAPTPHTDCVSCVAFNPLYPQLASASYDGSVRFFTCDKAAPK